RTGGRGEQPSLDLLRRVEDDQLLLERPREAAAAQVPAVELLQEAARAALAQLADGLADEEDELGDDLLARRLAPATVDDLLEHPRVALCGTADHHGGCPRRRQHGLRLGTGHDV